MRGARRFAIAALTAGLLLVPSAALAQDATPPASSAPADAVGPRELQNFSLSGTVTRPADQPPTRATPAASHPGETAVVARTPTRSAARHTEIAPASRATAVQETPQQAAADQPQQPQQDTTTPVATSLPAAEPTAPNLTPDSVSPPSSLGPGGGISFLPWLLAAIALGAGGALLFWLNRSRPAYAGGSQLDFFTSPEPEAMRAPSSPPAPRSAPPPPPRATTPSPPAAPAAAPPVGIVSTALRGWIEVGMRPLRCIVTDDTVTFEFELDLFNSGSARARNVHVAAVVINAGVNQDQHLEGFFVQPAGPGERVPVIEPLKRVTFTAQIATSRDQIHALEMGGRTVFVPLLAFNAIYGQGRGEGQTSVSYLVGRNGDREKLAPFRLDLGPRVFRGLGARALPQGVRK